MIKASSLKGIVTIEMEREEAEKLAAALHNEIDQLLTNYKKFGEMASWRDLAIMGQVRDCLHRHLRTKG